MQILIYFIFISILFVAKDKYVLNFISIFFILVHFYFHGALIRIFYVSGVYWLINLNIYVYLNFIHYAY